MIDSKKIRQMVFLGLILLLYLIIACFKLVEIPGEWYGDISINDEYVSLILSGKWPWQFAGSTGPVFPYFISPIIFLTGTNYIHYKIATVIIGILGIIAVYLCVYELVPSFALLTSAVASISFWFLAFSRLGNLQILSVLFSALLGYFVLRYLRRNKFRDFLSGVIVSFLGLFYYPPTFVLPVAFILMLSYGLLIGNKIRSRKKVLLLSLMLVISSYLIFYLYALNQKNNFTAGYVGSKIFGASQYTFAENIKRLFINIYHSGLMLHKKGDIVFRVNVSGSPHLDTVSGIFFIFGLCYWLEKKRRRLFPLICIPLVALIVPSLSPALPQGEIPSSSRTLGIVPWIYLIVVSGIYYIYRILALLKTSWIKIVFFFIFIQIGCLNLIKYFFLYPLNLPNKNTPFGWIIAKQIDALSLDTEVFIINCCWGEWRQPEAKAIVNNLQIKRKINFIFPQNNVFDIACEKNKINPPAVFFIDPNLDKIKEKISICYPDGKQKKLQVNGYDIAWIYSISN